MAKTKNSQNQDLQDEKMNVITENKSSKSANSENPASDKWKIPSGWEVKKLGKLGNVISGLTYSPEDICEETGVLVLRSSNVQAGRITFDDNVFVKVKEGSFNPVKKNDILICVRNGSKSLIGKCALINDEAEEMAFGAFMAVFRGDFNNYLFHVFSTDIYYREIHKNLGATINSINGSDLKEFKIPLPPLPEQTAIAQLLSTWDNAITKTQALIAQKEQHKKWLMQNLLTGKMRLKGFEKEWKENKLSELFVRVTRKNTEGNTTVVTISAQRGFVRQTDFFNKNIASEITDNYFLVEKGEFCYNKSYSNGYPWGATKRLNDFDKAVVTTLYICFGVKNQNKTNPEYFEQYFGANHLDQGLTKIAHEGGRAHGLLNVTPSDFFSLKVTIPSYEEQTAIAQVLQAADKEIQLLKMKCEKLKEQKKGLMQQLLTGKIRLTI